MGGIGCVDSQFITSSLYRTSTMKGMKIVRMKHKPCRVARIGARPLIGNKELFL
jgi:hypothetical protein